MSVSVHVDSGWAREYLDRGYQVLARVGERIELADPARTCLQPMRDGLCAVEKGHLGRHSTVAFYCDGCGRSCRGVPRHSNEDVAFCFLCTDSVGARRMR